MATRRCFFQPCLILLLAVCACSRNPAPANSDSSWLADSRAGRPDQAARENGLAKPEKNGGNGGSSLAVVDGSAITAHEFALGYPAYRASLGYPPDTPRLRREYLDWLVDLRLLEEKAAAMGLENDPQLFFRLSGAKRAALEETLLERAEPDQLEVTPQEIEQHYRLHIREYMQPAVIQLRNITTGTREAAEAARRRILNGEDFRAVAGEVSTDPTRADGGELPPFSPGTYDPAFERQAAQLKTGEISQVFRTDRGYHVIQKIGETPRRATPLEQVRDAIRARLAAQKRQQVLREMLDSLRAAATISTVAAP